MNRAVNMDGPLRGIRVLEFEGLAPVPMAGKVLRDFGAAILRIDRTPSTPMQDMTIDPLSRGKRSIAINLKEPQGKNIVQRLCKSADVLIDSYRPGVLEKLGLGPHQAMSWNDRLIYARLTGYGQDGTMSQHAGHDINYLAMSGVLSQLGRHDNNPTPPINLLGDFAGGSFTCVIGIMAALIERNESGKGQVVDCSMVEGAAYISSFLHTSRNENMFIWNDKRGKNLIDTGAPFYDTYKTKDGKFMAVGAIEPQFYKVLIEGLGLSDADLPSQLEHNTWPDMKKRFSAIFSTKNQSEWCRIFTSKDSCVTPVLDMEEAGEHPHNVSRQSFEKREDKAIWEPKPAPKLSRSHLTTGKAMPSRGEHTMSVLAELGYSTDEIKQFVESGVVEQCKTKKSSL